MTTPNRHIPYVPEGTLDPAAGLNLALNFIDALLQTAVISMSLDTPPGSNSDGDLYIVAAGGTGAWAGLDEHMVRYVAQGDFWQSFVPGDEVSLIVNRDDGNLYKYNGGWVLAAGLSDAPNDGLQYVRQALAWVAVDIPPAFAGVVDESDALTEATDDIYGNYTRFSHTSAEYYFDDAGSWVVGAEYHGRYVGSGVLTIASGTGFTVNPPAGGTLIIPPGGTFTVKIVAADEADLFGVTVPQS